VGRGEKEAEGRTDIEAHKHVEPSVASNSMSSNRNKRDNIKVAFTLSICVLSFASMGRSFSSTVRKYTSRSAAVRDRRPNLHAWEVEGYDSISGLSNAQQCKCSVGSGTSEGQIRGALECSVRAKPTHTTHTIKN
jgi:hypothetical protein